jgi:predicted Zn-dependent protease with MMP-like domain
VAAVVEVSPERFEELVAEALDAIPEELGRYMDNVAVFVEEQRYPGLLGLYEGVPLTKRAGYGVSYNGLPMPDRITIFRRPICRMCVTEAEVVRQVGVTVVHEVAHHFGIGDDRLTELGWG